MLVDVLVGRTAANASPSTITPQDFVDLSELTRISCATINARS